ncbi:hypothetical protein EJB05_54078, partial [Eragrostis curvula]
MEFAVEVEVLARVRHKNLLGLRGYCAGAEQRMSVYDYMPNLSLLSHLHGQFAGEVRLDWKRRINVAIGSAEGLVYPSRSSRAAASGTSSTRASGARSTPRSSRAPSSAPRSACRASPTDARPCSKPVRMESVKYSDRLIEMDKSSSYYGEAEDGGDDEEEEEQDIDDDEVEEYSLMDDKSSMNFGAFGAMPVQTMQDPYAKRFSGNANNAIKI